MYHSIIQKQQSHMVGLIHHGNSIINIRHLAENFIFLKNFFRQPFTEYMRNHKKKQVKLSRPISTNSKWSSHSRIKVAFIKN